MDVVDPGDDTKRSRFWSPRFVQVEAELQSLKSLDELAKKSELGSALSTSSTVGGASPQMSRFEDRAVEAPTFLWFFDKDYYAKWFAENLPQCAHEALLFDRFPSKSFRVVFHSSTAREEAIPAWRKLELQHTDYLSGVDTNTPAAR